MRIATAAAPTAILALFMTAAPALAQDAATPPPAAAPAPAGDPTDAELAQFAAAMTTVQGVAASVQNGAPTAEQQAEMAAAVQNSGLAVERFNAISAAVSGDPVLQARAAVAGTTPSAPGSVGASVTDAEAGQFAAAMGEISGLARALNGAQPSAEQQAQMASAITDAGLDIERFNAISAATGQDAHLQARIALAQARLAE
ncbi:MULTISPECIES: DUF4168 domain-containing protein [unclassified Brevundimonas]|uniref:DUF4168 domain-containing protein n=1 Tax=unclassified Brevundimonas TaxID=2622653 RepID=UPI000CFD08E6|nr:MULTISPECIES: DUF4168 domain-containing protein [unclassified Brevundimonas]PRA23731.1 hypothetical protein CQ024_15120 [Brevundimonas sp. MYb27]PQZ74667.1 hypothetical protein CQ026_15470 [Brevundimonas sp. MYb31]PRB12122.1 hypothetical protein CQ039_14765 [Brevundimonas sp. MYb52]PRB33026.1 hypothetical protein CQ035_14275 [Brevundimonas sp. MYb46]PRB41363.1 hypothetical protein CQ028_15410 [Brevundimonas sp. MYb33]